MFASAPLTSLSAVLTKEAQPGAEALSGLETLRVRTINHRTHGFLRLSRLSAYTSSTDEIQAELTAAGVESVFLCTCNRRELYWRSRSGEDDAKVEEVLEAAMRLPEGELDRWSTLLTGPAVADHLFRVCAGLESAVMGEAEILGQVRAALESAPWPGSLLTGVVRAALRAGGAARAETAIGEGALSVASTAIQWLSGQVLLGDRRVLVVGAGSTARKAARHLKALGVGHLVVVNRTLRRAEELSTSLGAEAVDLRDLSAEILNADVVVSAVSAPHFVITRDHLRRPDPARPLFVIDLSMPPSVEPGAVEGVVRVDLTLLDQAAEENRRKRQREAPRVEAVLARELQCLHRWARREVARPLLARRRREIDRIREKELTRARLELKAAADPGEVLDRFSRRLFDRVLALDQAGLEEQPA